MAMMEPVSGLSEFVSVLAELRYGERSQYPFYCALLYTVAEGIDADLARYVDANWDELDAMTGDRCLVFVIGDVRDEAAAGHRPFSSAEVYRVADHLGVRPSTLPCAAFFARPDSSREVLRLRLVDYVADLGGKTQTETLTRAFRGMAAAVASCSPLSTDDRLDCLRRELLAERARIVGVKPSSSSERLRSAGETVESVEKVVVKGTSIATAVLGVLGLAL
jgi:hypothetical protein